MNDLLKKNGFKKKLLEFLTTGNNMINSVFSVGQFSHLDVIQMNHAEESYNVYKVEEKRKETRGREKLATGTAVR